ncbi:MAG: hypothetical protein ACYTGN_06775 [Planctomycetota bacterium]
MRLRSFLVLGVIALAALAKDTRVSLRVTASNPGIVTIDRGTRDGLEEGDTIYIFPRQGGAYRGVIQSVKERSAIVELDERSFTANPGTRGEALVPESRFADPEAPVPVPPVVPKGDDKDTPKQPEPRWKNKDDKWKPGMPLLTDVPLVKPGERSRKLVTGRIYTLLDITANPEGNYDNSLFRMGTDLTYRNPFKLGGGIRFNGEVSYLTETNLLTDWDLLVRRLSYFQGGDRFSPHRWEAGRFLQAGVAELGVLDGFEWGYRAGTKGRVGLSLGFMPEPGEDFTTGNDFQIAGFAEWTSGIRQALTLSAAYQKTWHNGDPDRDLVIGKWVYAPGDGWDFRGTAWIDFYTTKDDLKDSVEVTLAIVSLAKRFESGSGWDVNYRHQTYPQLLRNEFWPPVNNNQIFGNEYDRVWLDGWAVLSDRFTVRGHAGGWVDEDGSGGSAELGIDWKDFLIRNATLNLTFFGSVAQFENNVGARVNYGRAVGDARWDLFYEFTNHHLLDLPPDRDDLQQHRARVSGTLASSNGWDITVYGQVTFYDDQLNWSAGLTFQRRF